MNTIDFSEPKWLLTYYDVIGSCSIILNSLGLYLLIFKTTKLERFRYYLMLLQVSCALTDIHLTFLMKPVTLCPFIAIYTVGALSKYLDVSAHVCVIITGYLALVQLESLTVCFGRKHQAIAVLLKIHVCPNFILYLCYLLACLCPFVLCGFLHYISISTEDQLAYISKNHPNLLDSFRGLSHFVLYLKSSNLTWFYMCLFLGALALGSFFFVFILDMLRLMRHLKLRLSTTTYRKHKKRFRV